jgi:hypothetical protein
MWQALTTAAALLQLAHSQEEAGCGVNNVPYFRFKFGIQDSGTVTAQVLRDYVQFDYTFVAQYWFGIAPAEQTVNGVDNDCIDFYNQRDHDLNQTTNECIVNNVFFITGARDRTDEDLRFNSWTQFEALMNDADDDDDQTIVLPEEIDVDMPHVTERALRAGYLESGTFYNITGTAKRAWVSAAGREWENWYERDEDEYSFIWITGAIRYQGYTGSSGGVEVARKGIKCFPVPDCDTPTASPTKSPTMSPTKAVVTNPPTVAFRPNIPLVNVTFPRESCDNMRNLSIALLLDASRSMNDSLYNATLQWADDFLEKTSTDFYAATEGLSECNYVMKTAVIIFSHKVYTLWNYDDTEPSYFHTPERSQILLNAPRPHSDAQRLSGTHHVDALWEYINNALPKIKKNDSCTEYDPNLVLMATDGLPFDVIGGVNSIAQAPCTTAETVRKIFDSGSTITVVDVGGRLANLDPFQCIFQTPSGYFVQKDDFTLSHAAISPLTPGCCTEQFDACDCCMVPLYPNDGDSIRANQSMGVFSRSEFSRADGGFLWRDFAYSFTPQPGHGDVYKGIEFEYLGAECEMNLMANVWRRSGFQFDLLSTATQTLPADYQQYPRLVRYDMPLFELVVGETYYVEIEMDPFCADSNDDFVMRTVPLLPRDLSVQSAQTVQPYVHEFDQFEEMTALFATFVPNQPPARSQPFGGQLHNEAPLIRLCNQCDGSTPSPTVSPPRCEEELDLFLVIDNACTSVSPSQCSAYKAQMRDLLDTLTISNTRARVALHFFNDYETLDIDIDVSNDGNDLNVKIEEALGDCDFASEMTEENDWSSTMVRTMADINSDSRSVPKVIVNWMACDRNVEENDECTSVHDGLDSRTDVTYIVYRDGAAVGFAETQCLKEDKYYLNPVWSPIAYNAHLATLRDEVCFPSKTAQPTTSPTPGSGTAPPTRSGTGTAPPTRSGTDTAPPTRSGTVTAPTTRSGSYTAPTTRS